MRYGRVRVRFCSFRFLFGNGRRGLSDISCGDGGSVIKPPVCFLSFFIERFSSVSEENRFSCSGVLKKMKKWYIINIISI